MLWALQNLRDWNKCCSHFPTIMKNCWHKTSIKGMTLSRHTTWKYVVFTFYGRVRNAPRWVREEYRLPLPRPVKIDLMQQRFFFSFLFLTTPCSPATQPIPKILSALYGYDGCIGGLNSFSTEEEFLLELKRFVWSILQMMKIQPIFSNISCQKKLYCGGGAWGGRGEIVGKWNASSSL